MNSIQIRTKINQWWCVPVFISAGWVEFVVRNVDPITIGEQHAQHTCVCSYEPNFHRHDVAIAMLKLVKLVFEKQSKFMWHLRHDGSFGSCTTTHFLKIGFVSCYILEPLRLMCCAYLFDIASISLHGDCANISASLKNFHISPDDF